MTYTTTHYIGIDIAKQSLEICCPSLDISESLPNDSEGLRKLIKLLTRKEQPIHIICEASGGYEGDLLDVLWNADIALSLINPKWIRNFANSGGQLAKTDRIDASILAHYGRAHCPKPTLAPSQTERELSALVGRREELKNARQMEANRREHVASNKVIVKQIDSHIKFINKQIEQIEEQIKGSIERDCVLKRKVECLCQIEGIGSLSAISLLAMVPELGTLERKQSAALVGVAPYNYDSGPLKGQRFIRGGRAAARKILYMNALVACSHNPILKEVYQRLIAKGKAKKVAITAVMRKLIELINYRLKKLSLQAG